MGFTIPTAQRNGDLMGYIGDIVMFVGDTTVLARSFCFLTTNLIFGFVQKPRGYPPFYGNVQPVDSGT